MLALAPSAKGAPNYMIGEGDLNGVRQRVGLVRYVGHDFHAVFAQLLQRFLLGLIGPGQDVVQAGHALLDFFDLLVGQRLVKRDDKLIELVRHFRVFADVVDDHIERAEHQQAGEQRQQRSDRHHRVLEHAFDALRNEVKEVTQSLHRNCLRSCR